MRFFGILVLITCYCNGVLALNILGMFPYQGKSHFFVFKPYLQELVKRGHNLTVISYFPLDKPMENYHDISLAGVDEAVEGVIPLYRSYWTIIQVMSFLIDVGNQNCKTMMSNEKVQNLWKNNAKFDLILVEQFNSDCSLGIAHKLGGPVVGITSSTPMPWHYTRFGIPRDPSFVPFQFLDGGTKPTMYQRVERTIFYYYFKNLYAKAQKVDQNTLTQYLGDIPPLDDLGRDIKFMFIYTNYVLGSLKLLPVNVVELGGYHVAKPKELPQDLKKFIDESEHGVVFVSFGSMLRAASIPEDKLMAIIGALSELPQRVIWKWEDASLPGNPKNIYVSNWLPQNDILAHPKVLAFYSHCGLLGTTEAIHHGVPMVGMPVFGDQPANAAMIEESGLGVLIQINELTKENLLQRLKTVVDPKFNEQVKALSKAWHDRPMSAMDSAVYWTEYAARTKNFTFRTPYVNVPFYQSACLDVFAIITLALVTFILVVKSVVSRLLFSKPQIVKKSKRS